MEFNAFCAVLQVKWSKL